MRDWNHPAGRAGRQVSQEWWGGLEYICGIAGNNGTHFDMGEYLCEVTLPTTSTPNTNDPLEMDENNVPYFVTYYERKFSMRDEMSMFLQKNTLGPTKEKLDGD